MATINANLIETDFDLFYNATAAGSSDSLLYTPILPHVVHFAFAPKNVNSTATVQYYTGPTGSPTGLAAEAVMTWTDRYHYAPIDNGDAYGMATIVSISNDGSTLTSGVSEWKSDTKQN